MTWQMMIPGCKERTTIRYSRPPTSPLSPSLPLSLSPSLPPPSLPPPLSPSPLSPSPLRDGSLMKSSFRETNLRFSFGMGLHSIRAMTDNFISYLRFIAQWPSLVANNLAGMLIRMRFSTALVKPIGYCIFCGTHAMFFFFIEPLFIIIYIISLSS